MLGLCPTRPHLGVIKNDAASILKGDKSGVWPCSNPPARLFQKPKDSIHSTLLLICPQTHHLNEFHHPAISFHAIPSAPRPHPNCSHGDLCLSKVAHGPQPKHEIVASRFNSGSTSEPCRLPHRIFPPGYSSLAMTHTYPLSLSFGATCLPHPLILEAL